MQTFMAIIQNSKNTTIDGLQIPDRLKMYTILKSTDYRFKNKGRFEYKYKKVMNFT